MNELRSELELSADATQVQKDLQRKRDEDMVELKQQIEEEAKEHEQQMASLRQKSNQVAEELNTQLDQLKKNKSSVGKKIFYIFFFSLKY